MLTLDRDGKTRPPPRAIVTPATRRQPVGAEPAPGGVHFRVWAPARQRVAVVFDGNMLRLTREDEGGYWNGVASFARIGDRYRYRLDDDPTLYPDPASRFQPEGPHGPSEVIDPGAFRWSDGDWRGLALAGQVFYELHLGTFTREGTWDAARARLPLLRDLGITTVELMPVAAFPGRFGWGYDGVDLYAPHHHYGRPDDFRRFVDEAHRLELAVMLDVVYNHLGPDGNYLRAFSPDYFSKTATEWGDAINFDGPNAGPVRDFFAENAAYWVSEFHLDGLRLDATQCIYDLSPEHLITDLTRRARAAAGGRSIVIVAENESQETHLVRSFGVDGLWNDDFHHTAIVALTGRNEAYCTDYGGTAQELLSAVKHGYLYQGQRYHWQKKRRGSSTRGLPPETFVLYLENHDQVANLAAGARVWRMTDPGRHRAMTGLMLLGPGTPLLFQGQEWNASTPFLFFADHHGDLAPLVRKGRGEFLAQFPSAATPEMRERTGDPADPFTFQQCRLDWDERDQPGHREALALHRDLLALRRSDPVIQTQGPVDGAVLTPDCFLVRFFGDRDDRLLLVNLGRDRHLSPAPEPLLAPPDGKRWSIAWSSEDPRYGGTGTPPLETEEEGWRIPGHATVLLKS